MTWTEEKNARRCELIDLSVNYWLVTTEKTELGVLQAEMLEHRHSVAPLPLGEAREMHQRLKALERKASNEQ